MSDNVYIKVTVGRAYNKVGRYDIVVEAVNDNDEQVKNPVRLYLEAEADGVIVYDATSPGTHDEPVLRVD